MTSNRIEKMAGGSPQRRAYAPGGQQTLSEVAKWAIPVGLALAALSKASALAAAIAYFMIFIPLAISQPRVGLMLAFALVPIGVILPFHLPIHLDISDLSMAILLPICLFRSLKLGRPIRFGATLWPTTFYLTLCAISTIPHFSVLGLSAFVQMTVYIVFAVLLCASFPGDAEDFIFVFRGTAVGLAIFAILYLATHGHYPADNKNYWGAFLGSGFVILFELYMVAQARKDKRESRRLSWAILLVAAALLITVSRGGWMEAAVGTLIVLSMRGRLAVAFRIGMVLFPLVLVLWFTLPKAKQDYAFDLSRHNFDVRTRFWTIDETWAAFKQHPILGVGIQLRKKINAVNVATVTLAETGAQGLAAFILLQTVVIVTSWRLHRKFGPTDPRLTPVILAGALITCRLLHGLVDIYWSRGPLLWTFCAIGMMAAVSFSPPRRGPPIQLPKTPPPGSQPTPENGAAATAPAGQSGTIPGGN